MTRGRSEHIIWIYQKKWRCADMRIAVMEPLGVEQEKFMQIAREAVGDDVEIVC